MNKGIYVHHTYLKCGNELQKVKHMRLHALDIRWIRVQNRFWKCN